MQEVTFSRYGSPEVLEFRETEIPATPPDGVLVRVRATSVNAYDWHVLRGQPYVARPMMGIRGPKTRQLGLDAAGIVEAVGPEVTDLKPGDAVFGSRLGAFAEFVAGRNFVPLPAGLTFEQAAAVPAAAKTALQGLRDTAHLAAGQRVLVNGAGGGVGTFAVQIARALGAEVTAVTRTEKLDVVRSLGAEHVIDYRTEDFTRSGARYDVIFDAGGNRSLADISRALVPTGTAVLIAPGAGQWLGLPARLLGARIRSRFGSQAMRFLFSEPSRDDLFVLKGMLEAGSIRPVIDRVFPFSEAGAAIARLESGNAIGKVVISL